MEFPKDVSTRENAGRLPRIGITIGDPAGIGPEIVIKALADRDIRERSEIVLIGDTSVLQETVRRLRSELSLFPFRNSNSAVAWVSVYDPGDISFDIVSGVESANTGTAAARCIKTAVQLWTDGQIDAIATAPISKNALALAGYNFPGHTEFLAELTATNQFAMSFFADRLRVILLSTHCSLLEAIAKIKRDSLVDLIKFTDQHLASLLGRSVRLAVAGLNPHASEGGMFGSEEATEIKPAIEHCRSDFGIDVSGPYSPDTIFLRGFKGEFDGVVALYHDQATIAVKSLSFGSAVNVTLGLPLIRTSVDHGTAFDIAGKGIAEKASMKAAITLAADLVLLSKNSGRL